VIRDGVNIGGSPRKPLPEDPARAEKILRDRERRERQYLLAHAHIVPIYHELSRRPWREAVVG
jgi:hypothetical protein